MSHRHDLAQGREKWHTDTPGPRLRVNGTQAHNERKARDQCNKRQDTPTTTVYLLQADDTRDAPAIRIPGQYHIDG